MYRKKKVIENQPLLKIGDVAQMVGLSVSTIKNYINGGYKDNKSKQYRVCNVNFPKPFKVINGRRYYRRCDIELWLNS